MKKLLVVLAVVLLVCAFVGSQALAAGQQEKGQSSQQQQMSKSETQQKQPQANRASEMIGKTVKNDQGEELGSVSDIVIDRTGEVEYLILSHGGVLGIGDKLIPIPFKAAKVDLEEDAIVLSGVTKQELEKAPNFTQQDWNQLGQAEFDRKVYSFYGREGEQQQREERQQQQARQQQQEQQQRAAKKGKTEQQQAAKEEQAKTPMANRASEMIGRTVKNDKGEELGTVNEIVLDKQGQAQYIILSPGGMLGIGDKLIPIPYQAAKMDAQEEVIIISGVDKQMLEQAPNFSQEEWAKLGQPEFDQKVHGYYGKQ